MAASEPHLGRPAPRCEPLVIDAHLPMSEQICRPNHRELVDA
jgi:hypothetical protein